MVHQDTDMEDICCVLPRRFIVHSPSQAPLDLLKPLEWCGGAFYSITAALEAARDGDIVAVYPGNYLETIHLNKAVTLCSVDDSSRGLCVTVRSEGASTCVSTSRGARIVNMHFVHMGGDISGRGRDGPRCLEVCSGELTAERCSFYSEFGSAVMAAEEGSVFMKDCKLVGCGRCGLICVHGAKAKCKGCDLSGNALNGADVQSGGCVLLQGSRVSDNKQTGVLVADHLSYVHMEGNDICDNWRRGVTAQKSGSFCLTGNRIMGNKNIGVIGIGPWDEPSRALKIHDNVISSNVSTGLWIQKGRADVEGNVIDGNGDSGVVCFGSDSDLVLRSNIITNNSGAGVSVHASNSVMLAENFVGARHKHLGQAFRDAFMQAMHPRLGANSVCRLVDDNVCCQIFAACSFDDACPNKGCGVELHATKSAIMTNNLVANSGEVGVLVCEASTATLTNNTITCNSNTGLQIKGADTYVLSKGNRLIKGAVSGAEVMGGAKWHSQGDDVSLNGGVGVVLGTGHTFLKETKIDHNQKGGLHVQGDCSSATLVSCEVTRNVVEGVRVESHVCVNNTRISARAGTKSVVIQGSGKIENMAKAPKDPSPPTHKDSESMPMGV